MTRLTLYEYAATVRRRYGKARKKEKGRILDEFCQTTGLHRKAAIRLLRGGRRLAAAPKKKGRPSRYGPVVTEVLVKVWEAGDRMCGKLLAAVLPALVGGLERHGELRLDATTREALVSMSAATIDRQLRSWRKGLGRQPRRPAGAASGLKAAIPVRTWSEWKDVQPGSVQADLVLHCGESLEGFFLTTLTVVDVATGWTEVQPVWGIGMERVGGGVEEAARRLPIPLRELHTDNGGEFINHGLSDWCRKRGVRLTSTAEHRLRALQFQGRPSGDRAAIFAYPAAVELPAPGPQARGKRAPRSPVTQSLRRAQNPLPAAA